MKTNNYSEPILVSTKLWQKHKSGTCGYRRALPPFYLLALAGILSGNGVEASDGSKAHIITQRLLQEARHRDSAESYIGVVGTDL